MYLGLHVKYPLLVSKFKETRIFSAHFRKNTQILKFTKISQVGAESFHADIHTDGRADGQIKQAGRQAGMATVIVAFHNFAKTPKKPE
jgi:hypothetical protein